MVSEQIAQAAILIFGQVFILQVHQQKHVGTVSTDNV